MYDAFSHLSMFDSVVLTTGIAIGLHKRQRLSAIPKLLPWATRFSPE